LCIIAAAELTAAAIATIASLTRAAVAAHLQEVAHLVFARTTSLVLLGARLTLA
jgi:hypothetical protein